MRGGDEQTAIRTCSKPATGKAVDIRHTRNRGVADSLGHQVSQVVIQVCTCSTLKSRDFRLVIRV